MLLTTVRVPAQTRPKLADYFTEIPVTMLDARFVGATWVTTGFEDLDGDGNHDLIVLGFEHPGSGNTTFAPHTGRVFLGDGNGRFAAAPAALFPVDTLQTVFCLPHFADFNADNRKDMFLECRGWDVFQGPGEQNRLYLSRQEGGWQDVTDTLPQLIDRNTAVSVGDINRRGLVDIFVGNGNQGLNRILSYTLLNTGSGQFTQTSTNIPIGPGQLLDPYTGHGFFTATLIDLNDDGRPELSRSSGSTTARDISRRSRSETLWRPAEKRRNQITCLETVSSPLAMALASSRSRTTARSATP